MYLKSILQYLKDCLFPVFCLECFAEGEWWCGQCISKNDFGVFYCPVCHLKNLTGMPCGRCQSGCHLNGVAAFLNYDEQTTVGQLIKKFKYNFAYDIGRVWERLIDMSAIKIADNLFIDTAELTIIPVPLHIDRWRERGFNQSEIIATVLSKKLSEKFIVNLDTTGLVRKKYTKQQAKLTRVQRLANTEGAFVWIKNNPPGKVVILVDDVYTSGDTMQECAKILKKSGAQKVFGLVMARD